MSGRREEARFDEARLPHPALVQRRIGKKGLWALLTAGVLIAALLYKPLSRLVFQFVFAILIALCAKPIAALYERKLPRGGSCMLAILTLMLFFIGIIALLVPPVIQQLKTAAELIPTILRWGQGVWEKLRQIPLLAEAGETAPDMSKLLTQAGEWLTGQLPLVLRGLAGTVDKLSTAFIAPVLSYYFLRDREMFSYQLSLLIPLRHRKRMLEAMQDMKRETGAYVRGQFMIALIVGALTGSGLFLIGVPAWLVLGILMGICEIIPYIGPIIGSIPILLFALSKGPMTLLWALVITICVQQLEGMVIAPRMMSGATGLHPVHVLLLLTGGSMLFGIWGLLFSLPAFICLRSVTRIFLSGRQQDESTA